MKQWGPSLKLPGLEPDEIEPHERLLTFLAWPLVGEFDFLVAGLEFDDVAVGRLKDFLVLVVEVFLPVPSAEPEGLAVELRAHGTTTLVVGDPDAELVLASFFDGDF